MENWSMCFEKVVEKLQEHGVTRADILRMDLNDFIDLTEKYIGKVEGINFEKKGGESDEK